MEGRSPEERRAAAEARARTRAGETAETGDEELVEGSGSRGAGDAEAGSGIRGMSRHYGGGDVYLRRRLVAGAAVIVVIVLILLLVSC